jgi:hypothetical protein
MELKEKVVELSSLLKEQDSLEKKLKDVEESLKALQEEVVKDFELKGIEVMKIEGVGTAKLSQALYANIKEENKATVYGKLKELGHGELIKIVESIHHQTLRGFVGSLLDENKPIPEGINFGYAKKIKIKE